MQQNEKRCRKFNFTKTQIDTLPPHPKDSPSRGQYYSDQQVVGLYLYVSSSGRRFFHFRYRFNKIKRCLSIGEHPAVSIKDARSKIMEMKNLLYLKGEDPACQKKPENESIGFETFFIEEYLPFAKGDKKSWADDESKFRRYLFPTFKNTPLKSITARQIQEYKSKIKELTSPSTSNKHITLLIRIYNLAKMWGKVETSPCDGIKKYKEPRGKERYLSENELKRFVSALNGAPDSVAVNAIKLLFYTGLRRSEALKLLWRNVDLDKSSILLIETKAGLSRSLIINDKAKTIIEGMKKHKVNRFVFPSPSSGPKGHLVTVQRSFEKIKKIADIKDFRLHDCRHNFASQAVNSGVPLYTLQKLLGHSSIEMTQRYAHLADKEMKDATESVAKSLEKVTE